VSKKKVHRGQVLAAAVKSNGVTIVALTKRVGISRPTYYEHINDEDLSLEMILKYGKALNYDFSTDIPDLMAYISSIPESDIKYLSVEQLVQEVGKYKDKFHEVLEKLENLRDENNDLRNENKALIERIKVLEGELQNKKKR
jgi:transcriptional regulator with XRE-family HTH domain